MKAVFAGIAAFAFVAFMIFLAFSFSNATMSIQYWEASSRGGCAYLMTCMGAIAGALAVLVAAHDK